MSHNILKVDNQAPDANGNFTVTGKTLSDLNDVTITSVSTDHALKYNGTAWVNGNLPAGGSSYISIGNGEASNYTGTGLADEYQPGKNRSGEGYANAVGCFTYFYDTAPLNTISNATITKVSGTDWIESITLPAGKYFVQGQWVPSFSSTGLSIGGLYSTTSNAYVSELASVGDDVFPSNNSFTNIIATYLDFSSSQLLKYKLWDTEITTINTVSNMGDYVSKYSNLIIVKVA